MGVGVTGANCIAHGEQTIGFALMEKGSEVGMIIRNMDMQYNESRIITAILKVVATAELYDPDATEETIRYCVEQDLEDVGFDVSVELLKGQEPVEPKKIPHSITYPGSTYICGNCKIEILEPDDNFCPYCGRAVKWDD